ncbi:right-handed parallel beta-helix repeat-containing protein [Bacillus haynesii]|uniref:right-handed parallel beta-helix repeat-containing protein n=1 Tax=Bacillus haynesii TaxID=1925021 RepID=UPI0022821B2A|nr:right-handed parallel beta-helix repeat-containing protein [Bacillus haynesii]MCY8002784.1 right-handed parallel beta-helix repeat-containing protein [Bacillus haynesii]
MLRLIKHYNKTRNSLYESQLSEDMQTIENALNDHDYNLKRHESSRAAHTSEQIDHGGFTVGNRLKNLSARFANLVVNHDGKDVKEIVDSRVDTQANIHDTLKDRLDYENNRVNQDLQSRSLNILNYMIPGELDASLYIQRALDDAFDIGGAQVYVPASAVPYILKRTLVIKSNTRLTLNENAVFDRQHLDDFITNFEKKKGSSKLTGYNGYSNIIIEGGTWHSNGDVFKNGQAIIFAHAKNVIVRNVTIYDVCGGHAVELNGINTGLINSVKAFGFDGESYRGAFQIDLDKDGNPPTLGQYGSFDGTPCKNITIQNCEVGPSQKMGSWGRAIESHSSFIGVSHENIRIEKNKIHGTLDVAIRAYAWNNVYIGGNTITNCGAGIVVNPPLISKPEDTVKIDGQQTNKSQKQSDVIIENNTIDVTTLTNGLLGGIAVWGQGKGGTMLNVAVNKNTIKNTAKNANAVYVKESEFIKVDKNQIENTGHNGISIATAKYTVITKNQLINTAITGIYAGASGLSSDALQINGNTVIEAGGHGIHLDDATKRSQVHDNTIINAGFSAVNRYNGVYITNASKNITLRNNNVYCSEKRLIAGVFVTETNSDIVESGNYVPDQEFYYQAPIVNQTT